MYLPKPNAMSMPASSAPMGLGLDACNSGNVCNTQGCANQSSGGGCGAGLAVGVIGIIVTCALA